MSTKLSPDKWACGCPKPISCQNKNLVQLTLRTPIPVIPILGSSITSSGGGGIGLFLAISQNRKIIWIELQTGIFAATQSITTSAPSTSVATIKEVNESKCCSHCTLQYIKNGVIICQGTGNTPNTKYNTAFNSDYYFKQYPETLNPPSANKWNCCHGQYKWLNNNKVFFTKNNRGTLLGDISYSRNQRGRWNQSLTNWKLFPRNSVGRANPICRADGRCIEQTTAKTYDESGLQYKHSGRLFENTHPNMSKRQLFAYLVRNRKYLNR